MAATILLITDPAESDRLARTLARIWGRDLHLLADLPGPLTAEQRVLRAHPDVLIVGLADLTVARSYVQAARRLGPGCTVVLLCESSAAAAAQALRPDLVLQRPLTGAAVQGLLAELSKGRRDSARLPAGRPQSGRAPAAPAAPVAAPAVTAPPVEAALARVDDLFVDPLALPRPAPRVRPRDEADYAPRRARSAS